MIDSLATLCGGGGDGCRTEDDEKYPRTFQPRIQGDQQETFTRMQLKNVASFSCKNVFSLSIDFSASADNLYPFNLRREAQ